MNNDDDYTLEQGSAHTIYPPQPCPDKFTLGFSDIELRIRRKFVRIEFDGNSGELAWVKVVFK